MVRFNIANIIKPKRIAKTLGIAFFAGALVCALMDLIAHVIFAIFGNDSVSGVRHAYSIFGEFAIVSCPFLMIPGTWSGREHSPFHFEYYLFNGLYFALIAIVFRTLLWLVGRIRSAWR
jgi:hypothetical protein